MYTLGADLREHTTIGFFHQDRVEAIRSADEERTRAHRARDARGNLRPSPGVTRQSRVCTRHAIERQYEYHDAAAVDRAADLLARNAGPGSHRSQAGVLDLVPEPFVILRRPFRELRAREHRRVLARTVVMQASGR